MAPPSRCDNCRVKESDAKVAHPLLENALICGIPGLLYRRVSIKAKAAHSDTQNCPSMWHVRFQTCGSKTSAEQERRMDNLISLGQHGGLAEATGALRIYLHAKVGPNSHCQEETCATV